jgi:hypothetical protein
MIDLKIEIMDEVSQHLPPATKEKINRLEYEFMSAMNSVSKEYLEKAGKPEMNEKEPLKKVEIE